MIFKHMHYSFFDMQDKNRLSGMKHLKTFNVGQTTLCPSTFWTKSKNLGNPYSKSKNGHQKAFST